MHILFVCSEYPPCPHGGIGVFTKTLAEALFHKGHTASVIGYDETVVSTQTEIENGILVRRLPKYKYRFKLIVGKYTLSVEPFASRKNLSKELEIFIQEIKPDLVESYDWSGPLYKKPSIPLIVRMHGANSGYAKSQGSKKSRILSHFEKKNIQFSKKLVAVSKYIGDITLKSLDISNRSFDIMYNAVDISQFSPNQTIFKDPNKLLYVGRIHPLKGLKELIECCNILFKKNKNLHLDIIGHGDDLFKQYLESIVDQAIKYRIRFIGKIPHQELSNYYNSATLFIMPSKSEAFGLTAIEAMACETAVAITNKASGPEIVSHLINGILVNFNNPISSAELINNLLQNKALIKELANCGMNDVRNRFSIQYKMEQNIVTYKQVLNDI